MAILRGWLGFEVVIKAATYGLMLLSPLAPELPQDPGRASAGGAIAYPIALAVALPAGDAG